VVHRYYDPTTALFLTVDPMVAQTQEPYGYTGGDPVNQTDPSGLCTTVSLQYIPGACTPAQLAALQAFATNAQHGGITVAQGCSNTLTCLGEHGVVALGQSANDNRTQILSNVATVASVGAAVTAFIPGVGTAVSVGLGALAAAADASNASLDHTSWGTVALDVVALVPGVAELHYLQVADEAAQGARALSPSTFGRYTPKGVLAVGGERDTLAARAALYGYAARNVDWLSKALGATLSVNALYHLLAEYEFSSCP
jgi:hypothetical protein